MAFYNETNVPSPTQEQALLEISFDCLTQNRFAEAFLTLSKLSQSKIASAHFNLGLCNMKIFDFKTAVLCFEKALQFAKMTISAQNTDAYVSLRKADIKDEIYLKPMSFNYEQNFQNEARENIAMALIVTYKKLGFSDKAKALSNSLRGVQFDDFKESI